MPRRRRSSGFTIRHNENKERLNELYSTDKDILDQALDGAGLEMQHLGSAGRSTLDELLVQTRPLQEARDQARGELPTEANMDAARDAVDAARTAKDGTYKNATKGLDFQVLIGLDAPAIYANRAIERATNPDIKQSRADLSEAKDHLKDMERASKHPVARELQAQGGDEALQAHPEAYAALLQEKPRHMEVLLNEPRGKGDLANRPDELVALTQLDKGEKKDLQKLAAAGLSKEDVQGLAKAMQGDGSTARAADHGKDQERQR